MDDGLPGSGRPTQHNGGRASWADLRAHQLQRCHGGGGGSGVASVPQRLRDIRSEAPCRVTPVATRAAATTDAAPSPFVEYLGGKVLQHVKVYGVVWGTSGTFPTVVTNASAPNMADFFSRITNYALRRLARRIQHRFAVRRARHLRRHVHHRSEPLGVTMR